MHCVCLQVEAAFEPALAAYGITSAELGTMGATSQCTLQAASAPSPPMGGAAGLTAGSALAAALAAAAGAAMLLA